MTKFARLIFQPCRRLSDCPWATVIVQSRICPLLATISASCMLSSHALISFPNTQLQLHSEFDALSFFFNGYYQFIDRFWFQWRLFSGVNVLVENLPVWHLPHPLDSLFLCALPECVCPEGIRLRLYVCELYCLFFFHDLTPYSVEEAETHWEPLHFLPYFFLLNVTMSLPNRLTHSEFSFHRK